MRTYLLAGAVRVDSPDLQTAICLLATGWIKAACSSHVSSQGLQSYTPSLMLSIYNILLKFFFLQPQDLDVWMDFVDSGVLRTVKMLPC